MFLLDAIVHDKNIEKASGNKIRIFDRSGVITMPVPRSGCLRLSIFLNN